MEKRGVGFDVILWLIIMVVILLLVMFFLVPNWGTLTEKWKDVQDKLIVQTDKSGNILKSAFKRLSPEGKEELLKKYSKDIEEGCDKCDKDRITKLKSVYDAVKTGEISGQAIDNVGYSRDKVKRELMKCISYCDDVDRLSELTTLDKDCDDISNYRNLIENIGGKLKTSYSERELNEFIEVLVTIRKSCSALKDDIDKLIGKATGLKSLGVDSELGKIKENKEKLKGEGWYNSFQEGIRLFERESYDDAKRKFEYVKDYNGEISEGLRGTREDYKVYSEFFINRISALQGRCNAVKDSSFFKFYVDINSKKINNKALPETLVVGQNTASKYMGVQLLYDLAVCKGEGVERFEYYDILLRARNEYKIDSGVVDKIKKTFFEYCSGNADFNKITENVKIKTCMEKNQKFNGKEGLFNCVFLDTHNDYPTGNDIFNVNDGDCVPCVAVQSETYSCELYGKSLSEKWFGFNLFGKGDNDVMVRDYCNQDVCNFNIKGGCVTSGKDKMFCSQSGIEIKEKEEERIVESELVGKLTCAHCDEDLGRGINEDVLCSYEECSLLTSDEGLPCMYRGIQLSPFKDDCIPCLNKDERSCEDYNSILEPIGGESSEWAEKACRVNMCKVVLGCKWHSEKKKGLFNDKKGLCLPDLSLREELSMLSSLVANMKISKPDEMGNGLGRYYFRIGDESHVIEFESYKITKADDRRTIIKDGKIYRPRNDLVEFTLLLDFWVPSKNKDHVKFILTNENIKGASVEKCFLSMESTGTACSGNELKITFVRFDKTNEVLVFNLKLQQDEGCVDKRQCAIDNEDEVAF